MLSFLDTYYNETRLKQELENTGDYTFLALVADNPVGYIRFVESQVPYEVLPYRKPLELNRLYVDKPFLGQGLAHQLMDFYLDFAEANRHDYLWLGVWEHNYRAQAFYKKFGFAFTGHRHPFPIGDTPQTDEWWAKTQDAG